MTGVKSNFVDANGKEIYSGQLLCLKDPKPGELNIAFMVFWNKDIGFRFRGQMLTKYILDRYQVVEDISWIQKHLPKWI